LTRRANQRYYSIIQKSCKGGRIAGKQVQVAEATPFQNRDYPVLTDHRALFAGLLQRLYGLQQPSLERLVTGIKPKDLGLV
jgi:uncharacterized protein (DUF1501 family)